MADKYEREDEYYITDNESCISDELNAEQSEAVRYCDGHALVLAGAGTGKTRVIIHHAWYLISVKHIDPRKILLVTFTRKAASEMIERLKKLIGPPALYVYAGTFHQFCLSNIRRYSEFFRSEGFSIIDRDDQSELMKIARSEYIEEISSASHPEKKDKAEQHKEKIILPSSNELLSLYSYIRNTDMDYADYLKQFSVYDETQIEHILKIYSLYEQKKQQHRYFDFDDLLVKFADALSENENLRSAVCRPFWHVLVDEMQDTNPIQWRILDVFKEYAKLFCVGDDAQSIYAFRGADFKSIHSFSERVRDAQVFRLSQNYRSTQQILDFANWILEESPLEYKKHLVSAVGKEGRKPLVKTFFSEIEEAGWVIKDILKKHKSGIPFSNIMVIVRTGYAVRNLEHLLLNRKIPYIFIGGMSILQSAHIKDILSLIRASWNYRDSLAWMRYLCLYPGIGGNTAGKILNLLSKYDSFEAAIASLNSVFSGKLKKTIENIIDAIKDVKNGLKEPRMAISEAIEHLSPLLKLKYSNWAVRKKDFNSLLKMSEEYKSMEQFLETYTLNPVTSSELDTDDQDKLILITTHSAKGTEADICYLFAARPGMYPHTRAEAPDAVEEERRVLYVAVTRARNELIITRSLPSYGRWYGNIEQKMYFLERIPRKLIST